MKSRPVRSRAQCPGQTSETARLNRPAIEALERRAYLSISFGSVHESPTVPAANAGAVADFNGDGLLDIAVAGGSSQEASLGVSLGKGDGTFGAPLTINTGHFPDAVVTADFNGDGKADIAIGEVDDGTVGVFLGNGDGTFQSRRGTTYGAAPFPDSGYAVQLAVADFNGDTKPDLIVADHANNQLVTLIGSGTGTFAATADAFYGSPTFPVAADFNGDGKPDISYNPSLIRLGDGHGGFAVPLFSPAGDFTTIHATVAADFDADGKLDLAVAGLGTLPTGGTTDDFREPVNVQKGAGDGTLLDPLTLSDAPDTASVAIVAADFNADGKVDLATAAPTGAIDLFEGNGDGSFQARVAMTDASRIFQQAVAADVNNDHFNDLVLIGSGVSGDAVMVLLGGAAPTGGVGGAGGTAQLVPTVTGTVPAQVIQGLKTKARLTVTLRNVGNGVSADPVSVQIFTSADPGFSDDDIMIAGVAKKLMLRPKNAKALKFDISNALKTASPGAYYLLAKVTDALNQTTVVAFERQTTVATPVIDLTGTMTTPAGARFARGKTATVAVAVANAGNVLASGPAAITLTASATGTPTAEDPVVVTAKPRLKIKPARSIVLKLKFRFPALAPGSYSFLATLTPGATLVETDQSNNAFPAAGPFTVV